MPAEHLRYDRLFERANFSSLSTSARQAFDVLGTQDFERVIRVLRDASTLLSLYSEAPEGPAQAMRGDADGLREILVQTIAGSHPAYPGEITDAEYAACATFLDNFNCVPRSLFLESPATKLH